MSELVKYLVAKALANEKEYVQALRDYYINGLSIDSIVAKYGIERNRFKNMKNHIFRLEFRKSVILITLKSLVDSIVELEPIVVDRYCVLCERYVEYPVTHVRVSHWSFVTEIAFNLLSSRLKQLNSNR